jgi:hypothetical protein
MHRSEAINIAKKLKALAERASGAEKLVASEKLRTFCCKHGLDAEEYDATLIKVNMPYKNEAERMLLCNVVCMVMESDGVKAVDKNGSYNFQCTPHQLYLIKDAFAYYNGLYQDYCEAILAAMIMKNEIINTVKSPSSFSMEPMTAIEHAEVMEKVRQAVEAPSVTDAPPTDNTSKPKTNVPPSPSRKLIDAAKRQDQIMRFLYVMEQNKWAPPAVRAKLFLS